MDMAMPLTQARYSYCEPCWHFEDWSALGGKSRLNLSCSLRQDFGTKLLQSQDADLATAVQLLGSFIRPLTAFQEYFEDAKLTAEGISNKWGVNQMFERIRLEDSDGAVLQTLSRQESYFRVHMFHARVNIVIYQLTQRFTGGHLQSYTTWNTSLQQMRN